MAEDLPRKLGPYLLVESLGHGGMAEVYRARRDGPGGFQKDLALKQILPQYSKNKELVARFMEEARIAGALIHGNIVQVYDFGLFESQYYIAMEYIDGMSLASALDRCVETGIPLPSPIVAYIGAEVCAGLAYAHDLTDESGQRIEIVHRDVSPQNILLSFAGDVKLGDFGIVKAADSLVRTEAGLRLGKINYMSPEQSGGDKLDGRSDLFALGVTLWEALTLRPLLPRGDAVKTIEKLSTCDFPKISSIRRDVPPDLEELIGTALKRDRGSRFRDGEAMARALRAFVHTVAPGFGRHDLVEYLEWLRPSTTRTSGVGPPALPALGGSTVRGGKTQLQRRRQKAAWIALASAPVVGLACGALAFAGLNLLVGGDEATVEPPPASTATLDPQAQPVAAPPPSPLPALPPSALPAEPPPVAVPAVPTVPAAPGGEPGAPPEEDPPSSPGRGNSRRRHRSPSGRGGSRSGKPDASEGRLSPRGGGSHESRRLPDPF